MKFRLTLTNCYGNYYAINETATLCGDIKMLASLLIITLSVNGGLYLGTIAWSAYKSSEAGKIVEILEKVRPFPII